MVLDRSNNSRKPIYRSLFLVILALLLLPLSVRASQYQITSAPEWVEPVTLDLSTGVSGDQTGTQYLLVDIQTDARSHDTFGDYFHFATRARTIEAVERESIVDISFDPAFERVEIHGVWIHRGEQKIDALDTASIQVLHREENAQNLLYDGRLTINIILNGVRKGDVIEHSYTTFGVNPAFEGEVERGFSLNWAVPVARVEYRVLTGNENPVTVRTVNTDADVFSRKQHGNVTVYHYSATDVPAYQEEDNVPEWYMMNKEVVFSSIGDWPELIAISEEHYQLPESLPDVLERVIRQIESEHTDIQSRVLAALQWAQQEVRYLGIELGAGSYIPSPINKILARRFGDCKDKTLLLLTMLDALGVEAAPALVNSRTGENLPDQGYRLFAFDHVIVHASVDGDRYWLDPTGSYQQGELDSIYQPDFGYALVLDSSVSGMPLDMSLQARASKVSLKKTIDARTDEITMTVTTQRYGLAAERFRSEWLNEGSAALKESYLDFYQGLYGKAEMINPIEVDDKGGYVSVTETYRLLDYWQESDDETILREAPVLNELYTEYLYEPDGPADRAYPYNLAHPVDVEENITVYLPFVLDGDSERTKVNNPWFDAHSQIISRSGQNEIVFNYRYSSNANHVDAGDFPVYLQGVEKSLEFADQVVFESRVSDDTANSAGLLEDLEITREEYVYLAIVLYFALGLPVFLLLAHLERKRFERRGGAVESVFYPIAWPRLAVLAIGTFSLYLYYWAWKNFSSDPYSKYSPGRVAVKSLFFGVTMVLIGLRVVRYAKENNIRIFLNRFLVGVITLIGLFIYAFSSSTPLTYIIIHQLAVMVVYFPVIRAINTLNRRSPVMAHHDALRHHSRFRVRDLLPLSALVLQSGVLVLVLAGWLDGAEFN